MDLNDELRLLNEGKVMATSSDERRILTTELEDGKPVFIFRITGTDVYFISVLTFCAWFYLRLAKE